MHAFTSLIDDVRPAPKLPRMPRFRFRRIALQDIFATGLLLAPSGCEHRQASVHNDTASISVGSTTMPTASTPGSNGWNRLAGVALFVQGDSRDEAVVLFPAEGDSAVAADTRMLQAPSVKLNLFGRGGQEMTATLGPLPSTSDSECRVWPLSTIQGAAGAAWAVGFVGEGASPLPLDSVDVLTPRDSMALAAEASRLASSVTASTAPSFQGLQFTAHDIRHFEAAPGIAAIVAHLIRKVNQEASPLEEQTLLIAERDSGVKAGPYHLMYADRTHGLEEELVTPEVIAGVRIAGRATLIVARESDDGVAYVMLERMSPGQWRVRWTSARTRCG